MKRVRQLLQIPVATFGRVYTSALFMNLRLANTSQNLLGAPSSCAYTLLITRLPISSRICLK